MKSVPSNKKQKLTKEIEMSTDIVKSEVQSGQLVNSNLPSYLQKYQSEDAKKELDNLRQYWVPPRLKVIQGQSGDQYKQKFQVGDVILVPELTLISKASMKFWITPIFSFTEYATCNPYKMKGQLPFIREKTVDFDSKIAVKARSKDKNDWYEICPEAPKNKQQDQDFKLRHCEFINFLCVLRGNINFPDHPANPHQNNPFIISFHHAGFWEGKSFATLIRNRCLATATYMFATQYEFVSADKTNSLGTWKGLNISNPSLESGMTNYVESEQDYLNYQTVHDSMQAKFEAGEIKVDYEDDIEEAVGDSKDAKF